MFDSYIKVNSIETYHTGSYGKRKFVTNFEKHCTSDKQEVEWVIPNGIKCEAKMGNVDMTIEVSGNYFIYNDDNDNYSVCFEMDGYTYELSAKLDENNNLPYLMLEIWCNQNDYEDGKYADETYYPCLTEIMVKC